MRILRKNYIKGRFGSCFLKLFYVLKNNENKKNRKNMFGSLFFFVLKNTENTKLQEQEQFCGVLSGPVF